MYREEFEFTNIFFTAGIDKLVKNPLDLYQRDIRVDRTIAKLKMHCIGFHRCSPLFVTHIIPVNIITAQTTTEL